jgi:hypothetical protein
MHCRNWPRCKNCSGCATTKLNNAPHCWLAHDGQGDVEAVRFDLDGLLFRGGMAEGALRLHSALGAPETDEPATGAASTASNTGSMIAAVSAIEGTPKSATTRSERVSVRQATLFKAISGKKSKGSERLVAASASPGS